MTSLLYAALMKHYSILTLMLKFLVVVNIFINFIIENQLFKPSSKMYTILTFLIISTFRFLSLLCGSDSLISECFYIDLAFLILLDLLLLLS